MRYLLLILFPLLLTYNQSSAQVVKVDSAYCAQLKKTNDSLYSKLFLANYKVEKVKYYLAIIARNPSQRKFLLGWMRRAVQ